MALTYGSIGKKRLVIETENLGEIVEIWMLNSKRPEGVIHSVIEVCYSNLDSPIVLVVSLYMPVDPDWTHVMSALQQWFIVFLWSMNPHHAENFGVSPAYQINSDKSYWKFLGYRTNTLTVNTYEIS